MKRLKDESGSSIMPVISIIVTIMIFYAGYVFGMPYYRYSSLESECVEIARLGQDKPKTLDLVYEKVQELKLPIPKEDITVNVDEKEKKVNVKISWHVKADYLGVYQKTLDFNINVTQ
ncbi:MAG: hypothetical protein HQK89_06245 [Nitrospirae bacterium]|nr:hypothetical protein [Nitrospirota bacterium]